MKKPQLNSVILKCIEQLNAIIK